MSVNISTKAIISGILALFMALYLLGVYWSFEPAQFDIRAEVTKAAAAENVAPVVGYTTTTALIRVTETLLNKPGGYLANLVAHSLSQQKIKI